MAQPAPSSVFLPASDQAAALAQVSTVLIVGAAALFLLVSALVIWSLRRHERPIPTRHWVIGGGVLLPSGVLTALLVYSNWRTAGLDRPFAETPLVIGVTGHMWWWDVRYREPVTGRDSRMANEIHLPVGAAVQLGLTATDVIHSLWVPALGGKMDMVPGRVNRLMWRARQPGVHHGLCAEYCGAQHARMALRVVVHEPASFSRWLKAQREPAKAPTSALALAGRQAFLTQGCAACHTIRGVSETGRGGPDLTHVGSRLMLGAGTLANGPAAMSAWLTGVQQLKPGAAMPSYHHLDAPTLQALSAYLTDLP